MALLRRALCCAAAATALVAVPRRSRLLPARPAPRAAPARRAVATMTVTPAIARAHVATRESEVRALERKLAAARAELARERAELALVEAPGAVGTFRETTQRSLVKAFGWRVTAGCVTFCSSMYFTKNLRIALAIVASDFLSKSGTMFIGERLFNKVKVGRSAAGGDSLSRSIVKALVWRVIAFVNTALVSGAIVKSAGVGSLIALSDSVFKTSLMVGYDQFWNRIDWGKELEGVDGDGI